MENHKVVSRSRSNKRINKKFCIIAGLAGALCFTSNIGFHLAEQRREQERLKYVNVEQVTNVQDDYSKKLWLNYLKDQKLESYNSELLSIKIDDCLRILEDNTVNDVNELLKEPDKYENTIFSNLVNIENYEGYYVSITDMKSKNVQYNVTDNIDLGPTINSEGKIYVNDEKLLEILYKEEPKELTFIKK